MKPWYDISAEPVFRSLQAFLFLLPFTIAGSYLLFTGLALAWLVDRLRRRERQPLPRWFLLLLLFAAFTLLSTPFSFAPGISLSDNRDVLSFLLVPICLQVLDSESRVRQTLQVLLASALLSALLGLAQALRSGASLDARLKGLTSHWMTFSGLLMLALVFFLVAWLERPRSGRRLSWLLLPALALMAAVLLLSLTRSAWIGTAAALLAYLLFLRPKVLLLAAPLLFSLVAALLVFSPAAVRQRLVSVVDPNDPSNRDRIQMVYSGWRLFLDHPLTGVGCNAVPLVIAANPARYRHPLAEKINPHLHNNFLQILAERGIFALLAFLAFCLEALRALAHQLRNAPQRWLAAGALFAFVGFLTAGLFEFNFGDSEVRFLLLFLLSLAFAGSPTHADDAPETS